MEFAFEDEMKTFAAFFAALSASLSGAAALQFEFVNNMEGYSNNDIYLMWAQTTGNTFSVLNGDGSLITLPNFGGQQSTGVALGSNLNATNGMTVTSVNSATLYIGLSKTGNPFASMTAAPSPQTESFPFMQVEITSRGQNADSGDITGINYFSFPVSVDTYSSSGTLLQSAGFGTNSMQTVLNALATTYNATPGNTPVVTDGSGNTVRILGPGSYQFQPASITEFSTGAYPTYQSYLAKVYADQNLSGNPTATKLSYAGNGGYTADLTVTKNAANEYGLLIDNVAVGPDITNPGSQISISGSIAINPDTTGNTATSTAIYTGTWNDNMGTITGSLATGAANNGLVATLLASVSASFETGALGSFTIFPDSSEASPLNQFRFQQSNLWFSQNSGADAPDPGLYFDQLQSEAFYDPFLKVISEMTDYTVYGSPYADRYTNWDVAINSTVYGLPSQPVSEWAPVDKWVITIGPTVVPEPSTTALLALAGAFGLGWRRRKSGG